MKRLIAAVLSACIMLSLVVTEGLPKASALANPFSGTDYEKLFDQTNDSYENTFVINPSWQLSGAVASTTDMSYVFRGIQVTEKYNASRHFSSFTDAVSAWEARYTASGSLTKEIASAVPNFILAAGTYSGDLIVRYSANIYGAQAGINPNDPGFDVKTALPTADWSANSARTGDSGETVISGKILRSNINGSSASDKKYETPLVSAGVDSYTLSIDGVKFTGSTAVLSNDLAYNVGKARTNTINVYNTIFSGVNYGLSASGDNSRNFNDYNLENVRVTALKSDNGGQLIYKYPHNVKISGMNFEKNSGALYTGATSSSSNDLWWTNCGGARGVSFTVTGSRFADNGTYAIGSWLDNCYLPSLSITFDGNIFKDASAGKYGIFRIDTFSGSGYPTVKLSFTNNTFYGSPANAYCTIFNGNKNYQKAAHDITFNYNKVIGFQSMLPNITIEMDSWLSSCNWDFNDNYVADTFTTVDDEAGKKPEFQVNTATVNPVNTNSLDYFFDYKLSVGNGNLKIVGANFEDLVDYFSINNKNLSVTAMLAEGVTITNPKFTASSDLAQISLWSDSAHTASVTSVSYDDLKTDGKKIYYLTVVYKTITLEYLVTFMAKGNVVDFAQKFVDSAGVIKNDAALLMKDDTAASGSSVTAMWQNQLYSFTVGVNAFGSVAQAKTAGVKQLILPSGVYGDITLYGGVELFGEGYAYNPNDIPAQRTQDWKKSDGWKLTDSTDVGTVTVDASASPADDSGTTISIKGVNLTGRFVDDKRAVSQWKTSVLIENCILGFSMPTSTTTYIFALNNQNAQSTDNTVKNIDEFSVKNCRYEFENNSSLIRLFAEICPANVTLDGVYFGTGFVTLGYPKWRNCVDDGTLAIQNCYFKDYSRSKDMIVALCGHADQCDSTGKTTKAIFDGNILIDCFNTSYNTNTNVALNIFPGAFTKMQIINNTFIDTANHLGNVIAVQSSTYSNNSSDFSDTIEFTGNRILGLTSFIQVNSSTKHLNSSDGNYYARYTDDYATAFGNNRLYGVLTGSDCYLDYAMTVLSSQMDMVIDRKLSMVNNDTREASLVIAQNERYIPQIKSSDGQYTYQFFTEPECNNLVGTLTKENVGNGRLFYAKAMSADGVSNTYKVYVSVGDLDAVAADTVGTAQIQNPYLFYLNTLDMPVGTVFTMPWQNQTYVFTAGVNAFASISQIINYHGQNVGSDTPNVILPAGVYNDDIVVTKSVNIYGEGANSTVLTSDPDTTDAVKIACVGDSITEGIGIDASLRPTSAYPAQLQTILNDTYGSGKYDVRNFGWGGSTINVQTNRETTSYTYWTYIYSVQYYKSLDFNPDIVVVMMGHNDTHAQLYTTAEQYREQYQALIDSYEALPSHPTVVIAGCTSRADAIRRAWLVETIIPMQKQLAADNDLIYVDMFSSTNGKESDKTLFPDGLHCTVAGYNMLATLIANGMSPILGNTRTVTKTDLTVDPAQRTTSSGKIKIACVGDSLTYGDKAYKGYPVYLQEMLGSDYEVRNFGECGAIVCDNSTYTSGTNWCYKSYERYTQSKAWDPDIVIMMLGCNDAGGHLTSFHSVNWTGGMQSTAAAEFAKDYKALVQEYTALGAQVYIANPPCSNNTADKDGTSILSTYICPIIENVATELSLPFIDMQQYTKTWDADMYCGTNSTGTVDNTHFSAKGYAGVAGLMFDNIFSVFADSYCDDLGEISSDAMIVDLQASTHEQGDIVAYSWEGEIYQFTWGENAFDSADAAINRADALKRTTLQILIPENSIGTGWTGDFNISADTTNIKSIDVFGQNRRFNPNNKSKASTDPSADWTRNTDWDMYSKNGGTSAVNKIALSCNDSNNNVILSGKLNFKGITLRNIVWNSERKVGTAENPRNLNLIFENVLVDFNAQSGSGGYLFNCNSPRNASGNKTFASDDSLTLRNFRIERFLYKTATLNRIVATYGHGTNLTLDGFYYNGDINQLNGTKFPLSQFGWIQCAPAAKSAQILIYNSNFRNDNVTLNCAPISNAVVDNNTPTVYEVKNNVFYNVSGAIATYPKYYSSFALDSNFFIQPDGSKSFITNNASHTDAAKNYGDYIGYTARDNTFVLADTSKYATITLNAATPADVTGCYVAQYTDGYQEAIDGAAPAYGKADYYYVDFRRAVKNTDFVITSIGAQNYAESSQISDSAITLTASAGQVIDDMSVTCKSRAISSAVYSDKELTTPAQKFDLPSGENSVTYYIKLSYGEFSKVYTVDFILGLAPEFSQQYSDQNAVVLNTAVALIPSSTGKEAGEIVTARWNGTLYSFTCGTNAFATTEDIYAKFADTAIQIIMPAGDYTSDLNIYGPWEVYGEDFDVNPNNSDSETWTLDESWGTNGQTVLKNANLVIAKSAAPKTEAGTSIKVSGLRLTKYIDDTHRTKSEYKTSITLKNNVYERMYLSGDAREFNLQSENNICQDENFTNIDEFSIVNMYYINSNPSSTHAMFQELVAPFFTIDGLCAASSCPTIGFPKVTKAAKKTAFTLQNSFFKELSAGSARFPFIVSFSGHDSNVDSDSRLSFDSELNILNNTFLNCGNESKDGNDYSYVLQIFPQAYNDINIADNNVISSTDGDYKFIDWATISYIINSGDYSNKISFIGNRLVGVMPSVYVNDKTTVELSENYFAKYTADYATAAKGDMPAQTSADYYLDYGKNVKISDMAPQSMNGVKDLTVLNETKTVYGYATGNLSELAVTGIAQYSLYSDKNCTSSITSIEVLPQNAVHGYIKAVNGNITLVYSLYIMGIDDEADLAAPSDCETIDGIDTPSVYYPTLYGAPDGIKAVVRYDGAAYKFTTGSNVVSTVSEISTCSNAILLPDSITEFGGEIASGISLYSANGATVTGLSTRKMKIACVGDSITEGVGTSTTSQNYPSQLQSTLGTAAYEVKNFGKSAATVQVLGGSAERGYTVFAQSQYNSSLSYNPDVVIIALGTNDTYAVRWDSNDEYANEYIDLIRTYQALPSKPEIYVTTALKRGDNTMMNERVEQNLIYLQEYVAKAVGGKVIDTHAKMAPYLDGTTTYFGDKLHPTPTGYTIMSGFIATELRSDINELSEAGLALSGVCLTGELSSQTGKTNATLNGCEVMLSTPYSASIDADSIMILGINDCVFTDEYATVNYIDTERLLDFGTDSYHLTDKLRGGTELDGYIISNDGSCFAKYTSAKYVRIDANIIENDNASVKDTPSVLLDSGDYNLGWYGLYDMSAIGIYDPEMIISTGAISAPNAAGVSKLIAQLTDAVNDDSEFDGITFDSDEGNIKTAEHVIYWNDAEQKMCTKYTLESVAPNSSAGTVMWIVYRDQDGNEKLSYSMLDITVAK